MSNLFLANVNTYVKKGGEISTDKNGKEAVILNVISGKCPVNRVIAGTVAERLGIETGNTYTFNWKEEESNEWGRQFSFECLGKASFLDLMMAQKQGMLEKPQLLEVKEQEEKVDEKKMQDEINSTK